jgi:hypothetical protein
MNREQQLAEWKRLSDGATPKLELTRYEHGGGRAFVIKDGRPELVADYYDERNREFYHESPTALPVLLFMVKQMSHAFSEQYLDELWQSALDEVSK